ncbi:MAG: hypothetical protein AAF415_12630 [Pseudomonadota bacterium]
MGRIYVLAACLLALGCAPKTEKVKDQPRDYSFFADSSCYTVDLFDRFEIQPASAEVPAEYRGFVGDWGNGAWNGNWCHDLKILSVSPTGEVDLLDMHAPKESIGAPATVFRRKAFINNEGELRFAYGAERHSYRLDGRHLVGKRTGIGGEWEIAMTRKDVVPVPRQRPERLALGD